MTLFEIVMKLNGLILPVGETNEDKIRLSNTVRLTNLVDELLREIQRAANSADRPEHSMKVVGKRAKEFLRHACEEYSVDD